MMKGTVSCLQEAPQEKQVFYGSTPAADQPQPQFNFINESTVELEGGHPEPMGAAATQPLPTSLEPSLHSTTLPQLLQVTGCHVTTHPTE